MNARFNVKGTFHLRERSLFVLFGDIAQGPVRPGMLIRVPFNQDLSMEAPIQSVESLDGPKVEAYIALTVSVPDSQDLELWKGLNIGGEELVIIDGDGSAT